MNLIKLTIGQTHRAVVLRDGFLDGWHQGPYLEDGIVLHICTLGFGPIQVQLVNGMVRYSD